MQFFSNFLENTVIPKDLLWPNTGCFQESAGLAHRTTLYGDLDELNIFGSTLSSFARLAQMGASIGYMEPQHEKGPPWSTFRFGCPFVPPTC